MKYAQRLDDARLAEVLNERGMADLDAIRDLLQVAEGGGMLFTEALVTTSLVADWDLSRVVSEIFQLPFLPVGVIQPDSKLWNELDQAFLSKYGIVPLSRFGQVLTIAMPALVPAEVLGMLSSQTDMVILPVVGTVESNRRWLLEHRSGTANTRPGQESDWGALFDAGDENVQLSLGGEEDEDDFAGLDESSLDEGLGNLESLATETTSDDDLEAELEGLEFTGDLSDDDDALDGQSADLETSRKDASGIDLPPMPEF